MKQKVRPKYGLLLNIAFMVRMAWKERKSVLALCAVTVALEVGVSVTQLLLAPVILAQVESAAPLGALLGSIAGFSLLLMALMALRSYVLENVMLGRIGVRSAIVRQITRKGCETSFPNTKDPAFLRLRDAANDASNGNSQPTEFIWTTLTNLGVNAAGFIIYLALLSGIDPLMLAVIVATTAAGFFVTRYMNDWGYRHREENSAYLRRFAYIREKAASISLAKDIRIFGLGEWLSDLFESTMRLYEGFILRRERAYLAAGVADVLLNLLRNGVAYAYLIHLTLSQGLPASRFLLYFSVVSGFTAWVTGILKEVSELQKENVGLSELREYLDYPETFRFAGGRPVPKAEGYELRLENVSFRYPGTDRKILDRVNLTIRPGERLAVVGLNGAGKTTLVSLLCGLYDPDEGRVCLNGTDIRAFNRQEYYDLFSAVFQKCSVLDITIAETVAQQTENIDLKRVERCIAQAGLTQDVARLPQGIHTHIGRKAYLDGVMLSGGQMQRLMLARALYKDGPILVLDEPTAALDPIAEHDIYVKYSGMTQGKTSVFISHRLASTRFCDRILFIENGVIAEEGTHEELLRLGGKYAALFEVQSRYYQEGRDFREEA